MDQTPAIWREQPQQSDIPTELRYLVILREGDAADHLWSGKDSLSTITTYPPREFSIVRAGCKSPPLRKNRPTTFKPLSLITLVESWRWILVLEMRKSDKNWLRGRLFVMWRRLYFFLFHCARWMQIPSFMKNRPTTFKPLSLIALVESWRWILALEMRKLDILLPHLLPLLPHQYHQFRRRAPPQKPPFVSITLRTTYAGIHTKTYNTTKTPWKS